MSKLYIRATSSFMEENKDDKFNANDIILSSVIL